MKVGDMIEVNTGHAGLIVDIELMYPGNPHSPPRNFVVMWSNGAPRYAFLKDGENISTINAFSVTKKITSKNIENS